MTAGGRTRGAVALLLGTLALAWSAAAALAQSERPARPAGYVADAVGALRPATVTDLDRELADYESRSGHEIAVALIRTTGASSIEDYALALFNDWEVGRAGVDDGVLLLLAMDDRRIRLQVGTGLEAAIPDARAQEIVDAEVLPRLRGGDVDGGVRAGAIGVRRALGDDVSTPDRPAEPVIRDLSPAPSFDAPVYDDFSRRPAFDSDPDQLPIGTLMVVGFLLFAGIGAFRMFSSSGSGGPFGLAAFGNDRCPSCRSTMSYRGRTLAGGGERVSEYTCTSCGFEDRRVRGGAWGGGSLFGSPWHDDEDRHRRAGGFWGSSGGSSEGSSSSSSWSGSGGSSSGSASSGVGGGGSSSGGGASGSW